ncbi:MAG: hypothetical protein KDD35_05380 [Bdellovibrionales bacterium]|nr:hypothetical protein [Bdellovibrionales bacterium]
MRNRAALKSHHFALIFFIWVSAGFHAWGSSSPSSLQETFGAGRSSGARWSHFEAYAPQKREYFLDIGSMWEKQNLYWLGGEFGLHVGSCVFSKSQTCQQYFDLLGGVAGADGTTVGLLLASLRWQFVNFPSRYSPALRIFVGSIYLHDLNREEDVPTVGLGYALTTTVHERLDLKLEARLGHARGEQIWSQFYLAMGLKLDSWVDYFANKIKKIGNF